VAGSDTSEWIGAIYIGQRANFIRQHRRAVTAIVLIVSVGTCVVMCAIAGWPAVSKHLRHLSIWFLPLAVLSHLGAYAGYLVAHHQVINRSQSAGFGWRRNVQVVVIGFGGWLVGGGFTVDRRALQASGASPGDATISTIALGLLELLVLTPAAWVGALVLLDHRSISASETIPWLVGVPLGFVLALTTALLAPARPPAEAGWFRRAMSLLGIATRASLGLLCRPDRGMMAVAGIALYWTADIIALWAALRFLSTPIGAPELIIAYATGYLFTRRTLPFAGAVIIEVLLAVSLWAVNVPFASAALAVLLYRLSDFVLTLGAALIASRTLERALTFVADG
jgi:uncharacterized membrane protein YbhN (UPF0104 family)